MLRGWMLSEGKEVFGWEVRGSSVSLVSESSSDTLGLMV